MTPANPSLPAPPSIRGLLPTEQVNSALITAEMTTCAIGVRLKSSVRRKCHVYTHPTSRCPASCPAIIRSRSRPLSPGPVGHRKLARSHVRNHRQRAGPDGPAQPGCQVLGRLGQPKKSWKGSLSRITDDVCARAARRRRGDDVEIRHPRRTGHPAATRRPGALGSQPALRERPCLGPRRLKPGHRARPQRLLKPQGL